MQLDEPVIGILRGVTPSNFGNIMTASFKAGLEAIEVTINTDRAERIIEKHRSAVPAGRLLGMGTVRNLDEAKRAVDAGAMFLVSPNLDTEVISHAASRGIPVIAGALTPTEVYTAWAAGAAMVKVFPCGALGGPQYIRDLRGPFDTIPLAAVGGVSGATLAEYFDAGVTAVGVGESLFGRKALEEKNWQEVGRNVKNFIDRCLAARDGVLSTP